MQRNFCSKMCRRAYVGCFNIDCNFAHSEIECTTPLSYAMEGVRFVEPRDDVLDTFLPRFIVRFDDEDDDEEEEEEKPGSTMSLSQLTAIQESEEYKKTQEAYLPMRMKQASRQRLFHMVREYGKLTMTYGEQDMEGL